MRSSKNRIARPDLMQAVARAGREFSDVAVIFHSAMARKLEMHPTDYKTMSILNRVGPLSAGEIARQTGLAMTSVTSLVDRLERGGFVRRVHDTQDRRRVLVEPVGEQVDKARKMFGSMHKSLPELLKHYSDKELATIADFLPRIAAMLRNETAKLEAKEGNPHG